METSLFNVGINAAWVDVTWVDPNTKSVLRVRVEVPAVPRTDFRFVPADGQLHQRIAVPEYIHMAACSKAMTVAGEFLRTPMAD